MGKAWIAGYFPVRDVADTMADKFIQQDIPVLTVPNNIKNTSDLPQQNQNINRTTNSYHLSQQNKDKNLSTNLYDLSQP